jgi:2-polyprenyl-3-methyl-5-hydroxy-6-metoxy-1,4-benzoquinol methylase
MMAGEQSLVEPTLQAVRRFWNEYPLYSGESRHLPGDRRFYEEHEAMTLHEYSGRLPQIFLRLISPGSRVLDVGCGVGFWVHQLSRRDLRVNCCDLSDRAVELTRKRAVLFGFDADMAQANAEALPYASEIFDHVNCQGVIHHTPDTAACLREFWRVLRPGGTLCFSVYYRNLILRHQSLYKALSMLTRSWLGLPGRGRERMMTASSAAELVRLYDGAANPIGRAYTKRQLHQMLNGFRIVEELRVGIPRRSLPMRIPDGVHRFAAQCFGLMIVVLCRKDKAVAQRDLLPGGALCVE